MDLLLSQYMVIGSTMLGNIHNSVMNFLIQTIYFVSSNIEVYSILVVESILISYFKLF